MITFRITNQPYPLDGARHRASRRTRLPTPQRGKPYGETGHAHPA